MTLTNIEFEQIINPENFRESGHLIWRVENFKPVRIEPEFHGQFYAGDSYIVLSSIIEGNGFIINEKLLS